MCNDNEWRPWIISEVASDGRIFQTTVRAIDPQQGTLAAFTSEGAPVQYSPGEWFNHRSEAFAAARTRLDQQRDNLTAEANRLGELVINEYAQPMPAEES